MLLRTRFYLPPLRANAVVRDRLLRQLETSAGGTLLLASAPAGYGKTTLISQWLHHKPQQFAWLSLGPEHDVIEVFWQYAIQSLQQIQPSLGQEAQAVWLNSPRRNYSSVVISLLNDLDALGEHNQSDDPITLVLDDFHYIKHPQLLSLINTFLDHLPSSIRVVMTSRDQPDLNLSRRRASGQLLQITAEELRFDATESLTFFHDTMSLHPADDVVVRFSQKTEGWVAGLQLVALSLKNQALDAEHLLRTQTLDRHVSDYLLDEVFQKQPEPLKHFLVQSALAPRFCAGLCNTMGQRQDSLQLITELEGSDLFLVALDNHRTWYRYHDLFRQFLLQIAQQWHQDEREQVCQRAVAWLCENGYYADALELCLQQEDWHQARVLLNDEWLQMEEDASQKKDYWLSRLPQGVRDSIDSGRSDHLLESEGRDAVEVEPLTRREQAVLDLISNGLTNKEIAEALFISPNTLKVHIRNLYGKMGVENRTQVLLKVKST